MMKKWLLPLAMTAGLVSTGNAADINRLKTFTGTASQWPWALNADGTFTLKRPDASDISFTQSGTGAVEETVNSTLRRFFFVDQFNAPHDGTDAKTQIQNAINAASAAGGGTVFLGPYSYVIDSGNLSIPQGVRLAGLWWPGVAGRTNNNYSAVPFGLYVNKSYTINLAGELKEVFVLPKGLPAPASARDNLSIISGMTGTGITIAGPDAQIDGVVVGGFGTCVSSSNHERLRISRYMGDCASGVAVDNAHDITKLHSVQQWPFLTTNVSWTVTSYAVSGAANNGSGAYRITIPSHIIQTGDTVWLSGVGGAVGANGKFTATKIDSTHIDLNSSVVAPTVTSTVTINNKYVPVSSAVSLRQGQTVSGTGIPGGTTIVAVFPNDPAILLSANPTASGSGVTLTIGNAAYTSGGNVYLDTTQRSGTAFAFTNSEAIECSNCFSYGYNVGFNVGTGAGWTQLVNASVDNTIYLADQTSIGVKIDGSANATSWFGGSVNSVGQAFFVNSSSSQTHLIRGVATNIGNGTGAIGSVIQGRVNMSGSATPITGYIGVGPSASKFMSFGNDMPNVTMVYGNGAAANSVLGAEIAPAVSGIVKSSGAQMLTAAVAGTDYLTPSGNGSALTGLTMSQISDLVSAWSAFTPTLTPAGGSFTTASATGRYKQIGKTVFYNVIITITTNGTASGAIGFTLPTGTVNQTVISVGREVSLYGTMVMATLGSGGNIGSVAKADNSYAGGDGAVIVVTGEYETN